jgi:hypothetical protein
VRSTLAANPGITSAPDAAKQQMYEQMAILGTFMLGVQEALKKTPNAQISANMKKAGEDYLRTFLHVEPQRVHVTNAGLRIDVVDAARPAAASSLSTKQTTLSSAALEQAASIETVGFYSKIGYGYGGMLTFDPTPIVLFKSGEALYEMAALKFAGGLAAHKAAHPKAWTTWRRSGKAIEVVGSKGWQKIAYAATMDRLPPGYRLVGDYQRMGGGGSGSSSTEESADSRTSVVTSGRAPNRYGEYVIDGYTLTLNYADGHSERRMIVTNITDPGVIWLDGSGYTSGK